MKRPVDLALVREASAELEQAVKACPTERTAAFLAGTLDGVEEMADHKMVRVPQDLYARAEQLTDAMAGTPAMVAVGRRSTAAVIRLALLQGLESLEAEHGKQGKTKGRK